MRTNQVNKRQDRSALPRGQDRGSTRITAHNRGARFGLPEVEAVTLIANDRSRTRREPWIQVCSRQGITRRRYVGLRGRCLSGCHDHVSAFGRDGDRARRWGGTRSAVSCRIRRTLIRRRLGIHANREKQQPKCRNSESSSVHRARFTAQSPSDKRRFASELGKLLERVVNARRASCMCPNLRSVRPSLSKASGTLLP